MSKWRSAVNRAVRCLAIDGGLLCHPAACSVLRTGNWIVRNRLLGSQTAVRKTATGRDYNELELKMLIVLPGARPPSHP
jgi:hypothetical protein